MACSELWAQKVWGRERKEDLRLARVGPQEEPPNTLLLFFLLCQLTIQHWPNFMAFCYPKSWPYRGWLWAISCNTLSIARNWGSGQEPCPQAVNEELALHSPNPMPIHPHPAPAPRENSLG